MFQILLEQVKKRPTIYPSNKSFSEWVEILGDQAMAAAVLDRILHHYSIINIESESYRLNDMRKNSLPIERRIEMNE